MSDLELDSEEEEFFEEELEETGKHDKKKRKLIRSEFIDDEAELSGDDVVSEDEVDNSDDDEIDLDLVDQDASDLDSEGEEEVRGLYQKQLESEDKRNLLLLQEQFEDKNVAIGEGRRRKFRWQTKDLIENSMRRHYDPDDDDSQEGYGDSDDDDCQIYDETKPRIRRPTAESLLIGANRVKARDSAPLAGPSGSNDVGFSDDSNSMNAGLNVPRPSTSTAVTAATMDLNRFLFRDKELVAALSTRETVILSREEKERNIQKELKKVQSNSIFDLIYS